MRAVVKGKLTKDFSVKTVVANGHDLQRVLKKFKKAGLMKNFDGGIASEGEGN